MTDSSWKQDASDYDPAALIREAQAEAWDEGVEAGYDHSANQSTPSGIPIDPPANPYREASRD